jgi:hypothetical protein
LLGVVVYVRQEQRLEVLYLALNPELTDTFPQSILILLELVENLKRIGHAIRGIQEVYFRVIRRHFSFRV